MFIKVGYELIYDCPAPTPMLFMLNIHYNHADEIVKPDLLVTDLRWKRKNSAFPPFMKQEIAIIFM